LEKGLPIRWFKKIILKWKKMGLIKNNTFHRIVTFPGDRKIFLKIRLP